MSGASNWGEQLLVGAAIAPRIAWELGFRDVRLGASSVKRGGL
jgi:hypothetical protein